MPTAVTQCLHETRSTTAHESGEWPRSQSWDVERIERIDRRGGPAIALRFALHVDTSYEAQCRVHVETWTAAGWVHLAALYGADLTATLRPHSDALADAYTYPDRGFTEAGYEAVLQRLRNVALAMPSL